MGAAAAVVMVVAVVEVTAAASVVIAAWVPGTGLLAISSVVVRPSRTIIQ